MKQFNKQAFTLVELIVVIIIISILGTISFISLQGYSKSSRDSVRISDVSTIKTSLELFSLDSGKYPLPDDFGTVSYSGETLWNQGTIGNKVITNLSRNLQRIPVDPLFNFEYIYSVTNSQNEYEILSIYESELSNNLLNTSYAANNYYPKITGNFNEVFIKTPSFIFSTPSIITSETTDLDFKINNGAIDSMIISGGTNFPNLNIPNTEVQTGGLDINLSVYEGVLTTTSTDEEKIAVINAIQNAYIGTVLVNNPIYSNILNSTDLVTLAEQLVLSKPASKTITDNTNGYNFTFSNASNWIQENGENGTTISSDKLSLKINNIYEQFLLNSSNASVSSATNYSYSQAFDGLKGGFNSGWLTLESPAWLKYQFSTPQIVSKYGIHCPNYTNWNDLIGRNWNLEGSTNNIDWNDLDIVVNNEWTLGDDIQFSIDNPGAYNYYRITMSNSSNGSYNGIGEFEMFGELSEVYSDSKPYYITTSDTNQLNLSGISKINSVDITSNQPTSTSIKGLVSFDGRNTWNKWNGSNWVEVEGDVNYSENKCTGGTAYAHEGRNSPSVAFNANPDIGWISNGSDTGFLGYQFSEAKILNKMRLISSNSSAYVPSTPSKFQIRAGNSQPSGLGQGTLLLDVDVQGTGFWTSITQEEEWTFNNSTSYNNYWIDILGKDKALGESNEYKVGELEFMEAIYGDVFDNLQTGNTLSEIEQGLSDLTITSETKLDFAFDFSTTDETVTPEISGISVDME